MSSEFDLDISGVLYGTDKASVGEWKWDYLRHYQDLFLPFKYSAICFIEIGVWNGFSIGVWESFFTNARLVGVDINPDCKKHQTKRTSIEIGSQEDPAFLNTLYYKYPPTIVVDDGSHQAHHIIFTFEHTFPFIAAGGLYIVEDLAFHFHKGEPFVNGEGEQTVSAYFLALAQQRLSRTYNGQNWGSKKYLHEQIDQIIFVDSAVIIRKRAPKNIDKAIATAELLLSQGGLPQEANSRYEQYLTLHGRK